MHIPLLALRAASHTLPCSVVVSSPLWGTAVAKIPCLPCQGKSRDQSHMFRMVLQALDEIRDGLAFIADPIDSSEEWEPEEKETIRQ